MCSVLPSYRDFAVPAGFLPLHQIQQDPATFNCSALKHFAAITSIMRDLQYLFNPLRHSFGVFVFSRSSAITNLQVSESQCAPKLDMRKEP